MLPAMTDLYAQVYAEAPYLGGTVQDCESFVERTLRQTQRPGFSIVWVMADQTLVGFAFGFTFPAGGWWKGEATPPPPEIMAGEKFAVIELVVRRDHRGLGLGRRLLDELLAGRHEPHAVLTAQPDAPARAIYDHWGWRQVGVARHGPTLPLLDQLVLDLIP